MRNQELKNVELFFWTLGFILFGYVLATFFALEPVGSAVETACANGDLAVCLAGRQNLINTIGVMISLGTFGAVIFGFRQARQTQMAEYKAYIRFDIVALHFYSEVAEVEIKLENYGRSPAKAVFGLIDVFIEPNGKYLGEGPQAATFSINNLHPGKPEIFKLLCSEAGLGFESNSIGLVKHGINSVKVQSRVSYVDTFAQTTKETFFDHFLGQASEQEGLKRMAVKKPYNAYL